MLDGDNSMQRMDDDIFSMFGFGGGGGAGLRKGQDLQITVPVTLEDIYLGKENKVSFQKKVICNHCRGTGSEDGKLHKCSKCKGRGVIVTQQQMGYQIIQYQTQCDKCGGTGNMIANKCSLCQGVKLKTKNQTLEFTVEKGISNNSTIKFEMESHHVLDGFPGDVIVVLKEQEHSRFKRSGDNLY